MKLYFAKIIPTCIAGALLLALVPAAMATSATWDGGGGSGLWSTVANWDVSGSNPASVPGSGELATFNGAGNGFTTIDLGSGVTVGGLSFGGSTAYTIGAGALNSQTLTIGGTAQNFTIAASAALPTINANLVLGANMNIVNNSGSSLTVANAFSGNASGRIINVTAGAVTFTGAFGATAINLRMNGASPTTITLGGSSTSSFGDLRVVGTGTLVVNGQTASVASSSSFAGNGKLQVQSGKVSYNAGISFTANTGTGIEVTGGTFITTGVSVSGASTGYFFTLNGTGASAYIGASGLAANNSGSGATTLTAGNLGANGNWSTSRAITLDGLADGSALFIKAANEAGDTANNITFSGALSGAGGFTKIGGGKLTLTTASYAGNTTISAGTLAIAAGGSLNSASSVSIAAGATFDVSAQTGASGTFTWGSSAGLTAVGGTTVATAAQIVAGASATVDVSGRPLTLTFAPASTSGDSTHPALNMSAGSLALNSSTTFTINNNGSALGAGDYTLISGNVSGTPTTSVVTVGGTGGLVSGAVATLSTSSGSLVLHVDAVTPSSLTLTRTAGTSPSTYGDSLTFHAVVSPDPGNGSTITFLTNGTAFGTATTTSGAADLTLNKLGYSGGTPWTVTAAFAGNSSYSSSSGTLSGGQQVNQKALTITSPAALNKMYDGNNTATLTGSLTTGSGAGQVLSGDTVTLSLSGTFDDANVGNNKPVTSTSTISGASANNYSLTQPTGLTASILNISAWSNASGGLWGTAGNWANNIIATNSGNTADFSQLNITADTTVSLDTAKTIGNLTFGDTDSVSAAGWTLDNNATPANTLTLAGTTPTITVNTLGTGKSVTISTVVASAPSLTKAGNGTLTLSGVNTYTGKTIVNAGTVSISADSGLGTASSSVADQLTLDGGALAVTTGFSMNANRGITLGSSGGTIEVASSQTLAYSRIVAGTGNLTKNGDGTLDLTQSGLDHTYGNLTLNAGAIAINKSSGLGAGTVTIYGGRIRASTSIIRSPANTVQLSGDVTLGASGTGILNFTGPWTINSASRTITVDTTVTNAAAIGEDAAGLGLSKAGSGTWVLSAANTYSGNTTVGAGTLVVNNTTGSGTGSGNVGVDSGGTLRGQGIISGEVTVNSGGTLTPSGTFPTTLTVNNTLSLGGTASFRINKSGVTYTSDKVAGVTTFTSGGTLNLTLNGGSDPLTGGESFTLVQATTSYGGTAPAAGTLPLLGSGLNWYLGNMPVNGSIVVNRAPVANTKTYGVAQGEAIVISVASGAKSLATDADSGDTLTVTSLGDTNAVDFGTASPTGGGASITYQNTSGSAGSVALFSYIVSDSKGGLATNSVSIQISPATGANLVSAAAGGGNAYLTYAGIPGTNYALDHATSIVAPITWNAVLTNAAQTNGFLRFTNNLSMYPTNDFYRTRYVP